MSVTDKELAVLREIPHSDYLAGCEHDDVVDMPVWSFSVCPPGMNGRTFSGVCGSLSRKGLVICDSDPSGGGSHDDTIQMTEAGWKSMMENSE